MVTLDTGCQGCLISSSLLVDNAKTMKRIFYELPKGNWLEEKIKDLEQTKNTEEHRRYK